MNEHKEYLSFPQENGSVSISEEVIATISYTAAVETEGVASFGGFNMSAEIVEMFSKKARTKGIKVTLLDNQTCEVEVAILIKYGTDISVCAALVQNNIKSAIESMTQVNVASVNVQISGVALEPKQN